LWRPSAGEVRVPVEIAAVAEKARTDDGIREVNALVPLRPGDVLRGVFHRELLPEPEAAS
jgi:hypothetical protein